MAYETALWPLQQAIYQRLSSSPAVSGLVKGVFDFVPKDQPYPYVVIGEPSTLPFDSKSTFGEEISLVIHVWSDYSGKKEAYSILNACQTALAQRLTIPDFTLEKAERVGMTVFDDNNPELRHGVLRMRYTLTNKE